MTRRKERALIALCSILYFTSYFTRKNFAAVMVELISLDLMDKEAAGLVVSALFFAYGAGQIISGFLGDRITPAALIGFGLGLTAVCNFAMPFSVGVPWLCVLIWALNGLAQAFFWPPLVRLLSENLTHERFVRANVVITAAAHCATICIFLFTALCLSVNGWHAVFFGPALLAAVVGANVLHLGHKRCTILGVAGCFQEVRVDRHWLYRWVLPVTLLIVAVVYGKALLPQVDHFEECSLLRRDMLRHRKIDPNIRHQGPSFPQMLQKRNLPYCLTTV